MTPIFQRRPILFRLMLFALVAIAARWLTFGNPIVHADEEFYLTAAHMMARGGWPYVDIWDRKPIGLFLSYLPAGALPIGWGVWAYQATALAAVIATAAVAARIVERAGWRGGAAAAGALYIFLLNLADGQGGQAPVLYNLPMAMAALLAIEARSRRAGVAAMALVGVAIQIKYSVVFEGAWFGLWLMWREHRRGAPAGAVIGYGAVLAGVALVPTLVAAAVYGVAGHGAAFVYANFVSILARHADPMAMRLANLADAALILVPLTLIASAGIARGRGATHAFLAGWLAMALAGFGVFGSWFNHYTLPVMLPAAIGAGGVFAAGRGGRIAAVALLALVFVAGQVILTGERRNRGTPAQFAAVVDAIAREGGGSLYVYSGSALLYPMTGRAPPTRYVLPSHLQIRREAGAIGVDQVAEIDRIFATRPAVVAFADPYWPEESVASYRAMRGGLARGGYRPVAMLPLGREAMHVWARVAPAPTR